jgi:hypothetical protein
MDRSPSVKDDNQYDGLPRKGMSEFHAAGIANTPGASKKGGRNSGVGSSSSQSSKRRALAGAAASAERSSFDIVKPGFGLACAGRG